jgi:hypothetical protein
MESPDNYIYCGVEANRCNISQNVSISRKVYDLLVKYPDTVKVGDPFPAQYESSQKMNIVREALVKARELQDWNFDFDVVKVTRYSMDKTTVIGELSIALVEDDDVSYELIIKLRSEC